ncbi:hypothetical protein [Yoonia sp. BS5-3]|uniref:Transferrin-binding protein B C-lobe/N-lobe beta barrel domain-containing protein n=1 Tax=Yoonia phaeophyticola TaxID=3137369 RepID=A0ABZ2V6X6_9RHOB
MRFGSALAALLLAGCGGGGSGSNAGSGIDPRLERLDVYEAQKLRVLGDPDIGVIGMAPTPDEMIPDTGTAVFTGSATIRVEDPNAELVLFGDSSVSIGFDDGAVSGVMDNFFGTDATGDVIDYSGTINIDDGGLDPALTLDYAGTLSGSGTDLVIAGVMQGAFLDDPLGALSGTDLEADIIYNGVPTDGTMIVIGETEGVTTAEP